MTQQTVTTQQRADVQSPPDLPTTMRAAVLFGPQDMRVVTCPVPQPGIGEVLVRVAMCGICGTDLKIYDGHFPLTVYPDSVTLDLNAVVRNDVTIYATRGEGGNNVKRAVALAAAGRLHGAELVTHHFPLAEVTEGFRVLRQRIGDPLKIVFVP